MNDLISRQAAIDAVAEGLKHTFVGWDGEQWNDGDGEQCPFEVIAWMPLPEPYREDIE